MRADADFNVGGLVFRRVGYLFLLFLLLSGGFGDLFFRKGPLEGGQSLGMFCCFCCGGCIGIVLCHTGSVCVYASKGREMLCSAR